ncbi:purple acid phosphatase 3-like isoform X1 [Benincasa hispida]|uniref:purple acid phosphatase 3-like isoform X1 n=1 Tax=Benincasa hispida TaxID=102211 RepID=UPI0019011783|nr:purple acid phosphatase 3-like isoform X1 [Benincasa hispida]
MGIIGEKLDVDFVISTGDNFYDRGLKGTGDSAFEESFSKIYNAPSLQKEWYSEIVEFFFVDTTPFVDKYFIDPEDEVYDWKGILPRRNYLSTLLKELDSSIKDSNAKWKIVVGHHTLKSAGTHGDTQELLHHLLPILEENKVDFYLNGHDHCLQHISSINSPLQYFTSGGGSKAWRGDINWMDPKELKFYYDGQGFMSLQITHSQANFTFFDIFGNILHQWASTKPLLHSAI